MMLNQVLAQAGPAAESSVSLNPVGGLAAVVIAVLVLALTAEAVSRLARLVGAPQSEPPRMEPEKTVEPDAAEASFKTPAEPDDPARIAAVITAAIKCVVPEDFRILSIQLQQGDQWELLNTWAIEGRRQIYTSHKIR